MGRARRRPQDTANAWSNADARRAFRQAAFRILETYHPRHLGLGIEVNTYWERDPKAALARWQAQRAVPLRR